MVKSVWENDDDRRMILQEVDAGKGPERVLLRLILLYHEDMMMKIEDEDDEQAARNRIFHNVESNLEFRTDLEN